MEKKFKLIKKYPGLYKELRPGDIATQYTDHYCRIPIRGCYLDVLIVDVENWPEFWQEIKEPLFVTHDEKELFSNYDVVFGVCPKSSWEVNYYGGQGIPLHIILQSKSQSWIYFSSKEAAEKWIDENKPVFSKEKIYDAVNQCFHSQYVDNEYNKSFMIDWMDLKKNLGL